ncbi:MAG: putative DNA-binding domain-containing protein [Deltaproteobacteria bacterium]|nr:putative DNA-binding domain-containing protein [Deltaproteobacteria bacterium]
MDLHELQKNFWHALTADPGRSSAPPVLMTHVDASTTQTPAERLQVYVDAYYWRLVQVLRETFPRLAAVVGDGFAGLVHDYLAEHPSEHPSVSYVGRHFAEFLARRSEIPEFSADLARLEWTRNLVFEAPDAAPVTVDALRQIAPQAWTEIRFAAVPAFDVIECAWPVHRVWADAEAALEPEATALRVWRAADYKVMHASVGSREAAALQRLRRGEPFAVICEAFADLPEEQAARAAMGWLLRWVEDGIVAALI